MITFHTNLDQVKWIVQGLSKTWGGYVPQIGTKIRFHNQACSWNEDTNNRPRTFDLQVVDVVYDMEGNVTVELHLGSMFKNIRQFDNWWKGYSDWVTHGQDDHGFARRL